MSKLRLAKTIKLFLFLLTGFYGFSVPPAKGGILLDPYFSYTVGKAHRVGRGQKESYGGPTGLGTGARLGLKAWGVFFGVETYLQKGTLSFDSKKNLSDYKFEDRERGVFFGTHFWKVLRFWVSYYWDGKVTMKAHAGGPDHGTFVGKGIKGALGLILWDKLGLNVEYKNLDYDVWRPGQGVIGVDRWDDKTLIKKYWQISLSFPFELF